MAGSQAEDEIATVLKENKTLLKLGCSFDSRSPQVLVDQYILRNNEIGKWYRLFETEQVCVTRFRRIALFWMLKLVIPHAKNICVVQFLLLSVMHASQTAKLNRTALYENDLRIREMGCCNFFVHILARKERKRLEEEWKTWSVTRCNCIVESRF